VQSNYDYLSIKNIRWIESNLLRQAFFVRPFDAAFLFWITSFAPNSHFDKAIIFMMTLNAFLYPYARFVYEKIAGFILGDNEFFVNSIIYLSLKFFFMLLCWVCAWCIAPFGLLYLYFYHTKHRTYAAKDAEVKN
jgi:hypothetical protein